MIPPKVSILMAVYNAGQYLDKAIRSVLAQSMPHWQLICVDDCSTDNSRDILCRYASLDERIQLFSKSCNEGQAVARNDALAHAKGEYVMMLDADDWLSADCLQQIVSAFCREESVDAVVLQLVKVEEGSGSKEPYNTPFPLHSITSGDEAFRASLDWSLHGIYAVRRDLHLCYPYDASCRLYSDDNTTRLHYLHSRKVSFCAGTYYYRQHAQSCTNAFSPSRFLYMEANLSMKKALEQEPVSDDVLRFYESHRWLNYIGQHWLFHNNKHALSPSQRQEIRQRFRVIFSTFTYQPVPAKFGYTWCRSYLLFQVQLHLYFFLRHLFGRV